MSHAALSLALSHIGAGRWSVARAALARVLKREPRHPQACAMMALACARDGQAGQAAYYADLARTAAPADPQTLSNVGAVLNEIGRFGDAAAVLREAVRLAPGDLDAALALGYSLLSGARPAAAAAALRAAMEGIEGAAQDPRLLNSLGAALHRCGRIEEALPLARRAAAIDPESLQHAENLAYMMVYAPEIDPAEQCAVFARYGRLLARAVTGTSPESPSPPPLPPPRPRQAGAKIRVGLLSPDLRSHAMAFFTEPLLDHLDRERFDVAAYFASPHEDATSQRLRAKADLWRNVSALTPEGLARRIRDDGVDALIDLAGLTQGHRLAAMALRPAPVQATMVGFPSTTGVPGIGLRIVDSITDPPGSEAFSTEHLVRLDPCFICYAPPADAPPVVPRAPGAPLTFVSFSNISKLNDHTLSLWAAVLRAAPGSRLRLRHFALMEDEVRDALGARLGALGIEAGRLSLEPPSATALATLSGYADADIALDTFPYNGTTTICEALLMGVPVVTLSGRSSASRVGRSILAAVGVDELCALAEEEYVALAAGLAADAARLAGLRAALRDRFLRSPVCDGPAYAARLGDALAAAVVGA